LGWKDTCTETTTHVHTHTPAREDHVGVKNHMHGDKHTHTLERIMLGWKDTCTETNTHTPAREDHVGMQPVALVFDLIK
jgi:hypothetical protein